MVIKQFYKRHCPLVAAFIVMSLLMAACNNGHKEKTLKNYILVGYTHGYQEYEFWRSQMNIFESIYLSGKETIKDTIVVNKKNFKKITKTLDGFEPSYSDIKHMDYKMFVVYNGKIYFIDQLGHVFNSNNEHILSSDKFIYDLMVCSEYYNWWNSSFIKEAPFVEKYGMPRNYYPIIEKEIKTNNKDSLLIQYRDFLATNRYSLVYLTETD